MAKLLIVSGQIVHPTRMLRLHHGTDTACATSIIQHGVNYEKSFEIGQVGDFWTTIDPKLAHVFVRDDVASAQPCILSMDVSVSAINHCLTEDIASVQMSNTAIVFEPQSYELLNAAMCNLTVTLIAEA